MAELHRQFEEAGGTTAFFSRVVGGSMVGPLKRLVRGGRREPGCGGAVGARRLRPAMV